MSRVPPLKYSDGPPRSSSLGAPPLGQGRGLQASHNFGAPLPPPPPTPGHDVRGGVVAAEDKPMDLGGGRGQRRQGCPIGSAKGSPEGGGGKHTLWHPLSHPPPTTDSISTHSTKWGETKQLCGTGLIVRPRCIFCELKKRLHLRHLCVTSTHR